MSYLIVKIATAAGIASRARPHVIIRGGGTGGGGTGARPKPPGSNFPAPGSGSDGTPQKPR